jgi:hypothetical protein
VSLLAQIAKGNRANRGLVGPLLNAGAPTSGASGSFVKDAVVGSLLVDTSAGKLYVATVATGATVTWTLVGSQV